MWILKTTYLLKQLIIKSVRKYNETLVDDLNLPFLNQVPKKIKKHDKSLFMVRNWDRPLGWVTKEYIVFP